MITIRKYKNKSNRSHKNKTKDFKKLKKVESQANRSWAVQALWVTSNEDDFTKEDKKTT